MSTSRTFAGAALAAGAIAVALALWMRGGAEDEEPTEEVGTSSATPSEEPEPFEEPAAGPAMKKPAPAAPVAQLLPPPRKGKDGKPEPLDPQIREHAILMMTPLAKEAMEQGQLEQLKVIQKEAKDRPDEGLMKPNDVEALDIAIGCLEKDPDAREDANDFLEFGTANSFGDSLKKACFGAEEPK